jgi:hypothetical protein
MCEKFRRSTITDLMLFYVMLRYVSTNIVMVQNHKVFQTDITQTESTLDQLFTKIRQNTAIRLYTRKAFNRKVSSTSSAQNFSFSENIKVR